MGVKAGTSFLIKLNLICGTERYVIRMEKLHLLHFSSQSNNNLGWQFTFVVFDFSSKMPTEAPSNGGSASPAPSSRADRFAHYFYYFLPSGKVTTLLEIFKKVVNSSKYLNIGLQSVVGSMSKGYARSRSLPHQQQMKHILLISHNRACYDGPICMKISPLVQNFMLTIMATIS